MRHSQQVGQQLDQIGAHLGEVHAEADESLRRENARLAAEVGRLSARIRDLERDSDMDPLVDVYNRRAFMREITRAQTVSERYHIPSCVVFLDLNSFKAVNDRYGHAIGDDLLRKIGKALVVSVRDCDLVARLGGDEFGILLFKTSPEEARAKAQRLACSVQACHINLPTGDISVSAAWGVAACEPGVSADGVLARADRAMYIEKASD
jgi:diguanylate cyclase (GGDEF)-like protein